MRSVRLPVRSIAVTLAATMAWIGAAFSQTLLRDAEIEQFLHDYADPIFEVAGLRPEAVEIFIVGDPSLNAFVTAGQKVFVHTGLITEAETPNQIEGVLAHETGHIAGGHQQRGAEAMAMASRPVMLSLVLGAAAIAAGAPDAGMGIIAMGQNVGISEFLSYSRGQEAAADQAAARYLAELGHSGKGLVEFFEKLSNRQLISSRRPDPYMQSHPLALRRVTLLRDKVAGQPGYDRADSEEEMDRLHRIQAKINGFMSDPQATLRAYPLRDQGIPARYARAVAYYRASDLDKALKEIDRLLTDEPDNAFFHELKGQMLFEHGMIRESVAPHRRSTELAPQYALLKINLGRSLAALENTEDAQQAVDVLKSALRQEDNNFMAWAELARAYAFLDQIELASLAQAQAYFAVGDLPSAHRFATRARDGLEPGTPEHLQALDIMAASEDIARRARNRGDGRGRRLPD